MTEFETVLDECLRELERGASNVDDCLRRHPRLAPQLEPALLTATYLQRGREARPTGAFKARVRTRLLEGMQAHPQQTFRIPLMWMRPAVSFAIILLALLVTGTAYAQSAFPGEPFYDWKLASENTWRIVSPDPVRTDLALAERRIDEMIAVRGDPARYAEALKRYLEVVARLKSEISVESEARIIQALEVQIQELNDAGILVPGLDQEILPPLDEPLPTPTATPPLIPEIPQVNPTLPLPTAQPTLIPEIPPVDHTSSPGVVPTVQAPPGLIPTDLNPTVDDALPLP